MSCVADFSFPFTVQHAKQTICEENIELWLALLKYRRCIGMHDKMAKQATHIWNYYLKNGADMEVRVPQ